MKPQTGKYRRERTRRREGEKDPRKKNVRDLGAVDDAVEYPFAVIFTGGRVTESTKG